jgi:hypothetical protein
MVLADWPNNLYRYLEALLRSNISDEAPLRMVNGPLRGFWIYASRSICPNEQVDFLRIALAQFVGDRGGPRLYKELMRRTGTEFSRLLITKQEFASRSGRAVETVNRFLVTAQIPFVETNYGKSKRKLIDRSAITLAPGKIYSRTKAAAIIGIPSHLLRKLKTSGIFRTPHYLQSMRGYHELDIQAFIEEMTNLVPDPKNDFLSQRVVAFGSILNDHYSRFATLDVKLSLVRSLLSREVPVLGAINGTVSGLLVSEDAIRQFSGDNLSIRETAKLLHCTIDSIAGLIKLGLLRSKKIGRIHLVTNEFPGRDVPCGTPPGQIRASPI